MAALVKQRIVFFDGVCNLCNGAVDFLLRHYRDPKLMFAPLQGVTASQLLNHNALETIVFYDAGKLYERSDAALKLCEDLPLPWRMFLIFKLVPKPIRDSIYNFVARNRYDIFGKENTCRIPSSEERARFLD